MDLWSGLIICWHRLIDYLDAAFIGVIGAGVAYVFSPKDKSVEAKEARQFFMAFLLSGGAIAHFMAAALMLFFKMPAEYASAVAFVVGAIGGSLLAAIIKSINQADFDLWPFIKSLIRAKLGVKEITNKEVTNDQ